MASARDLPAKAYRMKARPFPWIVFAFYTTQKARVKIECRSLEEREERMGWKPAALSRHSIFHSARHCSWCSRDSQPSSSSRALHQKMKWKLHKSQERMISAQKKRKKEKERRGMEE